MVNQTWLEVKFTFIFWKQILMKRKMLVFTIFIFAFLIIHRKKDNTILRQVWDWPKKEKHLLMKNKSERISKANHNWSPCPSFGLNSNSTDGVTSTSNSGLLSAYHYSSHHLSNSNHFAKSKHINSYNQCKHNGDVTLRPNEYNQTSSSSCFFKHYFLIAVFSALLYINSLNADFAYDDRWVANISITICKIN